MGPGAGPRQGPLDGASRSVVTYVTHGLPRCPPGPGRPDAPLDPPAAPARPAGGRQDRLAAPRQPAGGVPAPARARERAPGQRAARRHAPALRDRGGGSGGAPPLPGRSLGRRAEQLQPRGRRGGRRAAAEATTMSHVDGPAPSLPPVRKSVRVDLPPEAAFELFTAGIA